MGMKLFKKGLGAFLLGCSLGTLVEARDYTGTWAFGAIGQGAVAVGQQEIKEKSDAGYDLGASLRYGLDPYWSLGLSYENLHFQNDIRVQPILLTPRYSFWPEEEWTPFVQAGLGTSSGIYSHQFNHFASKLGVGLDYFMLPNLALGLETNYHYISDTGESRNHLHAMSAGLVLWFYFGVSPDEVEARTNRLREREYPQSPAAQTAEVPLPVDSDGDGVMDDQDACPNTPGGTKVDIHGCPLPPVETTPVAPPPPAPPEKVTIELQVLFDSGKAKIKSEFKSEIQKVADFMHQYPTTHAEIEGHTDNVGNVDKNMILSQQRADAVVAYLTDHFDIAPSRLTGVGYGPTKPIDSNMTVEGRKKNRRVVATLTATRP